MRTLNWTLNAAALAALTFAAGGCTLDIEHRDRYDDRPVVVERPVERPVVVERRYHYGYHPDHIVVVEQPPANQVVVATEAPSRLHRSHPRQYLRSRLHLGRRQLGHFRRKLGLGPRPL